MVTDSDLDFNSPMVRVNIDRAKASDSVSPCRRSATPWR
jgi:hypothetical protein